MKYIYFGMGECGNVCVCVYIMKALLINYTIKEHLKKELFLFSVFFSSLSSSLLVVLTETAISIPFSLVIFFIFISTV